MGECARCGAFTDNRSEKEYQYCNDCSEVFDGIRRNGVVVTQRQGNNGYDVRMTAAGNQQEGGQESTQVDAIARGKYLADELGVLALFEYRKSGSQWELDEYLTEHPGIRRDVNDRLSRVPTPVKKSLLSRVIDLF